MGCGQSQQLYVPGVSPDLPYLNMRSFEKLEVVGRTGFAEVWKLRNKKDGTLVAGKMILKTSRRFEWSDLYKKEINLIHKLGELEIEGVVKILGVSSPPDEFWTLMEFGGGGCLNKWMKNHPETAVTIAQEMVDTLHKLHSLPVSHGDLKPDNIIVTEDGHARLIDFEFARELKPGEIRRSRGEGTDGFQSPELIADGDYDPLKADVFAMGKTLELVSSVKPDWDDLKRVIAKMTAEDPENRPSMGTVAAALRRSARKKLEMDTNLANKEASERNESPLNSPIRRLLQGSPRRSKAKTDEGKATEKQKLTNAEI